ncbi:hypothetical protein HIM_01958 [Hirsutella minnesotensis 3608]|nr:hypothetical protein HIM_01958 [Hirsutella minnesotensis 3608]
MTPQELESLLQQHGSAYSQIQVNDGAKAAADNQRVELLAPVLSQCQDTWASKSSDVTALAQKLGDGSRDVAWRLPLGDSGILAFFLKVLAEDDVPNGLKVHALRLVGNSCADTEPNRARLVEDDGLSIVIRHLHDETLIPYTVPVLYNILVDYVPAQRLASKSRLSSQLLPHLSPNTLSQHETAVLYICKILVLLVEQEGEASAADPSTVDVLLKLATSESAKGDPDAFISLAETALAYLANEDCQARLIAEGHMELFMNVFQSAHVEWQPQDIDDADDAARLKHLRPSLLSALADLTGNDSYPSRHPLSSPTSQTFFAWLRGTNHQLQSAACLALGNLSRSDGASLALVERDAIHAPLIQLLSDSTVTDSQLLHLALSFCKNLAIPAKNKAQLGNLLHGDCVPRILSLDTLPQVQFAAISLTRLLLAGCPENVARICMPLGADLQSSDGERTGVSCITSLFDRSDAEPTKLEASRAIMAICRVLHSAESPDVLEGWSTKTASSSVSAGAQASSETSPSASHDTKEQRRSLFYGKHNFTGPLAFLVTLQKWPTLRSEGWFVLALMSRARDGAAVVGSVLQVEAAAGALTEVVTGRQASETQASDKTDAHLQSASSQVDEATASLATGLQLEPQQIDPDHKASIAKVDRENALVLCTELLQNGQEKLSSSMSARLQSLIKEGTGLVVADRSQ